MKLQAKSLALLAGASPEEMPQVLAELLKAKHMNQETAQAILEKLLAHYNDGRRKTLFHTAVYLLPLEDLQSVMVSLESRSELDEQPIKERALAAVELLQEAADRRGISLKLNKKPKKG